jgi:hypothetical protein
MYIVQRGDLKRFVKRDIRRARRTIYLSRRSSAMSQDTDNLLSQITEEIEQKEVEKVQSTNERVNAAYGSDGRGLIVVVRVMTPAKPDDLY